MSNHTDVIRRFVESWAQCDVSALMVFFADDCVYHNIPVEPVTGTEAVRKTIEGFAGMAEEIDWQLHAIAEDASGTVLTERLDRFKIAGSWVELPVMGTFELRDGKITAWRDYFDMSQFTSQLPGAGS